MSRYRGPRFKKIRRLGTLPGLTSKKPTVGSEFRNQSRSRPKANRGLQPKPHFVINKPLNINRKFGVGCASNKEEASKKKVPRGWRNKKIPTEDFSPREKVVLSHHPLFSYTVNKVLSLEHLELLHEGTGRKFKVRGEEVKHYDQPPP